MSMNEKQIVGESFEDLSDNEMALLTGRGGSDVAPASITTVSTVTPNTPIFETTGELTATILISIQACTHK